MREREPLVGLLSPTRYRGKHGDVLAEVGPQQIRDVVAAHVRHSDVEQNQMRLESVGRLASRLAVEHGVGLLSERLEKHLQRFGRVAVVVDDEHAEPA